MAIMECFSSPDSLHGILRCLHDAEGLSGLLAVALALSLWLVAYIGADTKRQKAAGPEMKYGLPVSSPPPFGSRSHAEAIHRFANLALYQVLLASLETALRREGYVFTTNPASRTPLTNESRQQVARAVFIAREHHMLPMQSDSVVAEKARLAASDGYCTQLLDLLTDGSEKLGWYITRTDDVTLAGTHNAH